MPRENKIRLCIYVCVVSLFIILANGCEARWREQMDAAVKADQQGQYEDAEKHFSAALQEAEKFGSEDPRLATTFNRLALVSKEQGKYPRGEAPINMTWRQELAAFWSIL